MHASSPSGPSSHMSELRLHDSGHCFFDCSVRFFCSCTITFFTGVIAASAKGFPPPHMPRSHPPRMTPLFSVLWPQHVLLVSCV